MEGGQFSLRFLPNGPFQAGLPLELWEDPKLATGSADREEWLKEWHSEREWFQAVHATRYSNGIISVVEALIPVPSQPVTLLDEYKDRKRRLRQVDMIVFARDHWNFNVRGFNPGGNHGAFFRASTHSVMLFAGGGVPTGLRVEEPYDSLSLVPTLLTLLGTPDADLPGPVIEGVVGRAIVFCGLPFCAGSRQKTIGRPTTPPSILIPIPTFQTSRSGESVAQPSSERRNLSAMMRVVRDEVSIEGRYVGLEAFHLSAIQGFG